MFMTYADRDKVHEILVPYKMWAYNDCEYNEEEARFIVVSELESEIRELEEKIRIMKLAKERVQDEGL